MKLFYSYKFLISIVFPYFHTCLISSSFHQLCFFNITEKWDEYILFTLFNVWIPLTGDHIVILLYKNVRYFNIICILFVLLVASCSKRESKLHIYQSLNIKTLHHCSSARYFSIICTTPSSFCCCFSRSSFLFIISISSNCSSSTLNSGF